MADAQPLSEGDQNRLDKLDVSTLVPDVLTQSERLQGEAKVHRKKTERGLQLVVHDDAKIPETGVQGLYTYFDREAFEGFDFLRADESSFFRVLLYGNLSQLSADVLFTDMLEVHPDFRRQGIGTAFQHRLAEAARKLGYRFLTGDQNDAEVARVFLESGRFLIEEVRPEYRDEVDPGKEREGDEIVFYTVKFLKDGDPEQYIKPSRLHAGVEDRIAYKNTYIGIVSALENVKRVLDSSKDKSGEYELIESLATLRTLNSLLRPEQRVPDLMGDLTAIDTSDPAISTQMKEMLHHLTALKEHLLDANLNG